MSNNTSTSIPMLLQCDSDVYLQCYAGHVIWKVVPVLFFFIGNLGNVLSIVVLCRRRIRKYSVASYLLFLALSDMTVLWTSTFRNTLYRGYQIDIRDMSPFYCKFHEWGTMTGGAFSTFIVTILTIERTLVTRRPNTFRMGFKPKTVRAVLVTVAVMIGAANSYLLYGFSTITRINDDDDPCVANGNGTCITKESRCAFHSPVYQRFYFIAWQWIVLVVYNIVPVVIIFTGNIIIAITLRQQKKKVQPQSLDTSVTADQQKSRSQAATKTLFILSAFFLITLTPYCIFSIIQHSIMVGADGSTLASLMLAHALVYSLIYSNFALNFFMYSNGSSLFRKEWKTLARGVQQRLSGIILGTR